MKHGIQRILGTYSSSAEWRGHQIAGISYPWIPAIAAPLPTDEVTYITNLHEIGHCVCKHIEFIETTTIDKQAAWEVEAWEFAAKHTTWPHFSEFREFCLLNHLEYWDGSPSRNHPFWSYVSVQPRRVRRLA